MSTLPTNRVEYSSPVPPISKCEGGSHPPPLRLPPKRLVPMVVNAVQVLQTAFTGTIATGLALVAIVLGGLMFAFGEGGAKRTMAGVIFGVGMAIGAVNFMSWLFPAT